VKRLFHIARSDDWEHACREGAYRVSSLGKRLGDEGFIHLSFAHQVKGVADAIYRGMPDLVVLQLAPERLSAPVVIEATGDSAEAFPHLYGELNIDAVELIRVYPPRDDGTFDALD
jgi:uncharacterized protein (DUF952 family)